MSTKLLHARAPHHLSILLLSLSLGATPGCPRTADLPTETVDVPAFNYPDAPRGDVVDDYFGTQVADPYRWLEDPDSPETRQWIDAENILTRSWLDAVPTHQQIHDRLEDLWNFERFSIPYKKGGRYFYEKNDGLQDQAVLYTVASLDDEPKLLLDPNTFSEDGTIALANYAVSESGRYLAFATSDGGSDWNTWSVMDVDSGERLADELKWIKFSGVSWSQDEQGFYYSRYPAPENPLEQVNHNNTLYYHRLGDDQQHDLLVYERPDEPEWSFSPAVTDDGQYLVIHVSLGTEQKNRLYYKDLGTDAPVVKLLDDYDASYWFLGNQDDHFWFQTNLDAPKGRIIAIDLDNPERDAWTEVVPEQDDALESASLAGEHLLLTYLHDARNVVRIHELDGQPTRELELPGIGSTWGFGGRLDDAETFYGFSGFTTPASVYRLDISTGESTLFRQPQVDFNPQDYTTEQVFYQSKDGTRVPMFITRRKDLEPNGDLPVLLYGYGGFNISLTPYFKVANLVWMEMGGVYAVPNIRGGGEYGEEWHLAGTRTHKQNVFDDFIAAGEWLVDSGYTRPERLAIRGGSNGGLLIGACLQQRPDLFAAAIPAVGVMDMLRYHLFTIGWAWASDYGTSEEEDMFPVLHSYSPVHNASPASYPATLITTADHDDRVVPAHSFKFAAAMQAAQTGPAPILIRIETRAGHSRGKPTSMRIDEATDEWAFLVRALEMEPALSLTQ